jgi:signal transduction histidine kinase
VSAAPPPVDPASAARSWPGSLTGGLRRGLATVTGHVDRLSLGSRFFLSAVLCCVLILAIAGTSLTAFYRRAAERGFDERLGVYIKELVADVASPPEGERQAIGDLGEPRFELPLSGWYWQITRLDGETQQVRASRSMVGGRLPRLGEGAVEVNRRGLFESYIPGPDERMLRAVERNIDVGEDGRFAIIVAAPADELAEDIREFGYTLALTFGLLGLALVSMTAVQVRFGLKPLVRLRRAIGSVRRGDRPRIEGEYPPDLAPLARELNQLLDSNREILDRARTQVGNLAHALKTPLSVMMNEADNAKGPLADRVQEQAAVMRDQVQYYLDRARAAALSATLGGTTDLAPSVEALIRTFEKIYRDRDIAGQSRIPPGLRFRGEKQDLEEMLGNLLDNAFKWAKTSVFIDAGRPRNGFVTITIDDDGPGMPDESLAQMPMRGRRLDETTPGSGLGLSIVVDMAKLHGGELTLSRAPQGGLRAMLRLPSVS